MADEDAKAEMVIELDDESARQAADDAASIIGKSPDGLTGVAKQMAAAFEKNLKEALGNGDLATAQNMRGLLSQIYGKDSPKDSGSAAAKEVKEAVKDLAAVIRDAFPKGPDWTPRGGKLPKRVFQGNTVGTLFEELMGGPIKPMMAPSLTGALESPIAKWDQRWAGLRSSSLATEAPAENNPSRPRPASPNDPTTKPPRVPIPPLPEPNPLPKRIPWGKILFGSGGRGGVAHQLLSHVFVGTSFGRGGHMHGFLGAAMNLGGLFGGGAAGGGAGSTAAGAAGAAGGASAAGGAGAAGAAAAGGPIGIIIAAVVADLALLIDGISKTIGAVTGFASALMTGNPKKAMDSVFTGIEGFGLAIAAFDPVVLGPLGIQFMIVGAALKTFTGFLDEAVDALKNFNPYIMTAAMQTEMMSNMFKIHVGQHMAALLVHWEQVQQHFLELLDRLLPLLDPLIRLFDMLVQALDRLVAFITALIPQIEIMVAGVMGAFGNMISAVGNLIAKIPGMGGVGKDVAAAGAGISATGVKMAIDAVNASNQPSLSDQATAFSKAFIDSLNVTPTRGGGPGAHRGHGPHMPGHAPPHHHDPAPPHYVSPRGVGIKADFTQHNTFSIEERRMVDQLMLQARAHLLGAWGTYVQDVQLAAAQVEGALRCGASAGNF